MSHAWNLCSVNSTWYHHVWQIFIILLFLQKSSEIPEYQCTSTHMHSTKIIWIKHHPNEAEINPCKLIENLWYFARYLPVLVPYHHCIRQAIRLPESVLVPFSWISTSEQRQITKFRDKKYYFVYVKWCIIVSAYTCTCIVFYSICLLPAAKMFWWLSYLSLSTAVLRHWPIIMLSKILNILEAALLNLRRTDRWRDSAIPQYVPLKDGHTKSRTLTKLLFNVQVNPKVQYKTFHIMYHSVGTYICTVLDRTEMQVITSLDDKLALLYGWI